MFPDAKAHDRPRSNRHPSRKGNMFGDD